MSFYFGGEHVDLTPWIVQTVLATNLFHIQGNEGRVRDAVPVPGAARGPRLIHGPA